MEEKVEVMVDFSKTWNDNLKSKYSEEAQKVIEDNFDTIVDLGLMLIESIDFVLLSDAISMFLNTNEKEE